MTAPNPHHDRRLAAANAIQADRNAAAALAAHERELHATDTPPVVWVDLDELEEMADRSGSGVQQLDARTFLALVGGRVYVAEERLCRHPLAPNGTCLACGERTGAAS